MADVVGYQLLDADEECPADFATFEILSAATLEEWKRDHPDQVASYRVLEIREGDVENPSFV